MDSGIFAFPAQGALLGLSAAFSPGAFQAFLINRTLSGGWRRGAIVAFAPLLSDAPIILVVLLVLNKLPNIFLNILSLSGGLFLLYLAWSTWRQRDSRNTSPVSPRGSLWQAILVNYLGPGPYLFWALVSGPILLAAVRLSWWHAGGFLAAFYGIFVGGMLAMVAIFHFIRRLGSGVTHWLLSISAFILAGFGLMLLYRGIWG